MQPMPAGHGAPQQHPGKDDKVTILINQKPYHLDHDTVTPQELIQLAGTPGDYEVWKVVKNPDAEGQLPVDDVRVTAPVQVKSGDKFRVVPPGTFGSVA